jgi:hypothetical protein
MTFDQGLAFAVIAGTMALFVWGRPRYDITACLLNGDGEGAADLLRRHLALSAEEAASSIREGLARIYAESVA